ncbi:ParA family protein [Caproicibacter fermentans]|uniref:ParA family protein n=1 Tax=Caproicibacter fermentans TaxID=2576756 RepID=A0A7G8TD53_9FIRM|nr:ParA family protein [Caproicibacter fermentans]QNK41544.1 ParA family protein [Caproicibacter fermentans]
MAIKTAAVWGSPGSGTTLTTIKIAKALANLKKNVIVVGCDDQTPLLPLLLPSTSELPSLGDALAADQLSQIEALRHCVQYVKNQYISLLGYRLGENVLSYPEYTLQRASELFSHLRGLADFVLIDCSSNLDNVLTAAALKQADVTFKVLNADPKSLVYFQSAAPLLLRDSGYRYGEQTNILNNVLSSQDVDPAREVVGKIAYTLPHVPELKDQYDRGELLEAVFGKTARQYETGIRKLVMEVMVHEPEHGIVRRGKPAVGDVSGTA